MAAGGQVVELSEEVLATCFMEAETDRGVTDMFRPRPGIVVLRILGHLSVRTARLVTDALEAEFGRTRFHLFAEWTAMISYDPAARKHCTEWAAKHRAQLEPCWFCAGNRLVEMGISVGAMAVALVGVEATVVAADEWSAKLGRHLSDGPAPADTH